MRFGEVGLGRDRLAMGAGGLFVILQLVERDAEIAQRHRHMRIDRERAPRRVGGEPGTPRQPQHLAEIGVKQRGLRREFGRALHMLDRLAELAVLVRDEAEQMLRFRRVRLRLDHLAAKRLRLRQSPLVAAAIGQGQRFTQRQERRWRTFLGLDLAHDRLDIGVLES